MIAIACVYWLFYMQLKRLTSLVKSRINTPDSVDSYIPIGLINRIGGVPGNPQHYHYPYCLGKWDTAILVAL